MIVMHELRAYLKLRQVRHDLNELYGSFSIVTANAKDAMHISKIRIINTAQFLYLLNAKNIKRLTVTTRYRKNPTISSFMLP